MRLLIVRHAIAVDRERFAETGEPDDARPLTAKGRRRMRRGARGLRRIVPHLDALAASPLPRAWETAEIIARAYRRRTHPPASLDALAPDTPLEAARDWLRAQPRGATVAIVGHEPHLSTFAAWLLTGRKAPLFELAKGGACLLAFEDEIAESRARLCWLLRAGQLRRLR
jgi:phosphohistidine phosphatase